MYIEKRDRPGVKKCGYWKKMGADGIDFLKKLAPYLIIKKSRAELVLEFWKHKKPFHDTNQPKPPGFIETCDEFHKRMMALNKKGIP